MSRRTPFIRQLRQRWTDADTLLCVGLDPERGRLPAHLADRPAALFDFCSAIVDATAPLVCAFKPQIAYFAALGAEDQLRSLIDYVHDRHPGIPVILDAKRGDIGNTARLYAEEAFERFDADAVTVNPYLGPESLEPYLDYADRGVIVLCRTSNPDSAWLQTYPAEDPAFLRVARAAVEWNIRDNVMLVAGATYADDLARIRDCVGDIPLLVPGVGAQGGDLQDVVNLGVDHKGQGLAINASRSVLYAGSGQDFATAAEDAARDLRERMNALRAARAMASA